MMKTGHNRQHRETKNIWYALFEREYLTPHNREIQNPLNEKNT